MPFTIKGAKISQQTESLLKAMDYKTEKCTKVDNISNIEVNRNLDVDMQDSFMSNLEV